MMCQPFELRRNVYVLLQLLNRMGFNENEPANNSEFCEIVLGNLQEFMGEISNLTTAHDGSASN